MNKVFFITSFFLSLFFLSCTSLIPGAREAEIQNIYSEYYSIAESYMELENYSKAIEFYEKAAKSNELENRALYQIALCNVYQENWDEAAGGFNTLLEKDPENQTLKLSLAYIEAVRGNLENAETLYKELCTESPGSAEPLKNLVNVLIAEKKYDEAKQQFSLLEETFPDEEGITDLRNALDSALSDSDSESTDQNDEGASSDTDSPDKDDDQSAQGEDSSLSS